MGAGGLKKRTQATHRSANERTGPTARLDPSANQKAVLIFTVNLKEKHDTADYAATASLQNYESTAQVLTHK